MNQPTEEELLILNSIIYTDGKTGFAEIERRITVLEWANNFDINSIDNSQKPAEISKSEFANIITTIQNNPEVYGNMKVVNVDNSQFGNEDGSQRVVNATIVYGDSTIIVYKGTGGDMEWRDSGESGHSNITDTNQQQSALEYFDEMVSKYENDNVYVTGHSKGGNKALYVGVLRGDLISHVYSFDGEGFNRAFELKYKDSIEKYKNNMTNICNEYDFINILLFPIAGDTRYIKSTTSFGIKEATGIGDIPLHKFGAWHSPYSMFTVDEAEKESPSQILSQLTMGGLYSYINNEVKSGTLSLNEETEQSAIMSNLQGLLAYYAKYMNEDDWRYACYSLTTLMQNGEIPYGDDYSKMPDGFTDRILALTKGYLERNKGVDSADIFKYLFIFLGNSRLSVAGGAAIAYSKMDSESYSDIVRDFSQSTKDMLLAIVQEVEEEPLWDVTRWEVYYKIEKFLGGVDFPSNSKELNNYYRKTIDMEQTSSTEINRIFNEVYEAEATFNTEMSSLKEDADEILRKLKEINENIG